MKQANPNHLYNKYNDEITELQERRKELIQKIEMEHMRKVKIEDVYQKEMKKLEENRNKIAEIEGQNFFSLKNQLKREKHENEELKFRLNDSNADIRRKRTKINEMRKQRTLLDGVYSKIESRLRKKGNLLLSLIEKTENLNKEKLESINTLKEIEEKAKQEDSNIANHIQSITVKHLNDKAVEEDSNLINSMITTKDDKGKGIGYRGAEQQLKKERTRNIMQEIREKDENQSIDWDKENQEAEYDPVAAQEKEVLS